MRIWTLKRTSWRRVDQKSKNVEWWKKACFWFQNCWDMFAIAIKHVSNHFHIYTHDFVDSWKFRFLVDPPPGSSHSASRSSKFLMKNCRYVSIYNFRLRADTGNVKIQFLSILMIEKDVKYQISEIYIPAV